MTLSTDVGEQLHRYPTAERVAAAAAVAKVVERLELIEFVLLDRGDE